MTTVDEDYHYLFGYAFFGLFSDSSKDGSDLPGVTKEYIVSHVVSDHEYLSTDSQARFSSFLHVRQDPFKETIYILRYSVLFMLA